MKGMTHCAPTPEMARLRNNAGTPVQQSTLRIDLVDCWCVPSGAGTPAGIYDDIGDTLGVSADMHLTPQGTVNPVAVSSLRTSDGPWSFSLEFNPLQSQYLKRGDENALRIPSGSMTFAAWFFSLGPTGVIVAKNNTAALEYYLAYNGSNRSVLWQLEADGRRYQVGLTAVPPNAWHLVIAWLDRDRGEVGIQLNAGAPRLESNFSLAVGAVGAPLTIGGREAADAQYFRGKINTVARWNRVLNAAERSLMFNTNLADAIFGGFTSASSDPPPGYPSPANIPAAPLGPELTVNADNTVTIEWVNQAVNALGIEIERAMDGGDFGLVYTANAYRDGTWQDTSADASAHQYTYRVRAVNYAGASAYSANALTPGDHLILDDGGDLALDDGGQLIL